MNQEHKPSVLQRIVNTQMRELWEELFRIEAKVFDGAQD